MTPSRFAEEANYWNTTVHPAKSQAEIVERLEEFGATNLVTAQGRAGERLAWMIRFEWNEATYRFTFVPLECRSPDKVSSFSGRRRDHAKQSEYQMGRIAAHFVKAILTAAEAHPHALFGFIELPAMQAHPNGLPYTAGELNVAGLTAALPSLDVGSAAIYLPQGDEDVIEGEVEEADQ
jgi:hypothetical protein